MTYQRTDEQRYAIISLYFDGRIKMNGPYPEITNISFLAKLFFKTFISLKHLSDYRTVGPSDCRIIATAPNYEKTNGDQGSASKIICGILMYFTISIGYSKTKLTIIRFSPLPIYMLAMNANSHENTIWAGATGSGHYSGVKSLFRQPISPTTHYSDSPLLRQWQISTLILWYF